MKRLTQLIWMVLSLVLIIASCKEKDPVGPGPSNKRSVLVNIENEAGEAFDADEITFDGAVIATNTSAKSITRERGTTGTFKATKEGYAPDSETVTFDQNKQIILTLIKKEPTDVNVTYNVVDSQADTAVTLERLTVDGEEWAEAAGTSSGTLTLPESETPVEVCGFATYFLEENHCETITPNEDQTLTLTLQRKFVPVQAEALDEDGNRLENGDIFVDGEFIGSGVIDERFPARAGDRSVIAQAQGYSQERESVSAAAAADLTFTLSRVYACSNNDDDDGDGLADEDDPGCVDENGNYDPTDDQEKTRIFRRTLGSNSAGKTFAVSGAGGERELVIVRKSVTDLDISLIKASVSVSVKLKVLVEEGQAGEEFALRWHTGPNDDNLNTSTTTEIIADERVDGEKDVEFFLTKDYFPNGGSYEVEAVHASKVRGEDPTDGEDDVVFISPDFEPDFIITIEYEPEEVE